MSPEETGPNLFRRVNATTIVSEANPFTPTVVLLDAPFRVALALHVYPFLAEDSLLLVHDWTRRSWSYKTLLRYFDVLAFDHRSNVFQQQPELNEALRVCWGLARPSDSMSFAAACRLIGFNAEPGSESVVAVAARARGAERAAIINRMMRCVAEFTRLLGMTGSLVAFRRAPVTPWLREELAQDAQRFHAETF